MAATGIGTRDAARLVHHFVCGAHRIAISSESLADLLGLMESECRGALEAMAARGLLRKEVLESGPVLYCK